MEQAHYEVDEKNRYRVETPGHQGWPRTARPGDPDKYLMISADCHANEPGNLWRDRIDRSFATVCRTSKSMPKVRSGSSPRVSANRAFARA